MSISVTSIRLNMIVVMAVLFAGVIFAGCQADANRPDAAQQEADVWKPLGKHELGEMYLNTSNYQKEDGHVFFSMKRVHDELQEAHGFQYRTQHVLHDMNCKEKTVLYQEVEFYGDDGQLAGVVSGMPVQWRPISPDGFVVKGYEHFCSPDTPI